MSLALECSHLTLCFDDRAIFQRKGRLANEAAEIRKQLSSGSDAEKEALVQSALEEVFDSVLEALLRSAAAGAELLEMQEVCTEPRLCCLGYTYKLPL